MSGQWRAKKCMLLVPCSGELFEDAGLLDPYLTDTASKEFMFKTNDAMINGSGVGMPLGIRNSPSLITVAADQGQSSGTVTAGNISRQWQSMHGPSRANSVWYLSESIDIDTFGLTTAPLAGYGNEQPAPTLRGRRAYPLENCQSPGTPGDVVLGDWSQYLLIMRGLFKTISLHLKFDFNEAWFRFVWRCDGFPMWVSPLTSIYSATTKSPFVVIAQR
jgi:HK97 family phage major capsid protein